MRYKENFNYTELLQILKFKYFFITESMKIVPVTIYEVFKAWI